MWEILSSIFSVVIRVKCYHNRENIRLSFQIDPWSIPEVGSVCYHAKITVTVFYEDKWLCIIGLPWQDTNEVITVSDSCSWLCEESSESQQGPCRQLWQSCLTLCSVMTVTNHSCTVYVFCQIPYDRMRH